MLEFEKKLEAVSLAARQELWRRGDLSWKLDDSKLEIHKQFEALPELSTFVFEKSRKVGGSFWALCVAFEACIRNPGGRVNYAVGTGKMASEIVVPMIAKVAKDAPPELKPEYSSATGHVTFPDDGPAKGAHIVLFGCEDMMKADRGRGPEAVLNIVDEAGFIPVLAYVLTDVLMPQVIHTKGKTLLSSSPPRVPGHEFCRIADSAANLGRYAHRNVYSPGGLMTAEEVEAYVAATAAGMGLTVERFKLTPTFKREILGLRVIDETLAVVPEFTLYKSEIIGDWKRPAGFEYVDRFVSCDPGMSDMTGCLFAYNDFNAGGIIVIEDELLLAQAATGRIATALKVKEGELWEGRKVYLRVADDPQKRLSADMWEQHGLAFTPAEKHNREELSIDLMRNMFAGGKVRVHSRCVKLIRQLENAVRTKPGGDMARTEEDGHFDLVAACWYLIRTMHAQRYRNPYPQNWSLQPGQIANRREGAHVPRLAQMLLGDTPHGRKLLAARRRR